MNASKNGSLPRTKLTVMALAGCLIAGCSRSTIPPINYYEVRLEATAPDAADCADQVVIEFDPLKIEPQPLGSLYQTEPYVDRPYIVGKPVLDGPNNWECQFTYRSRDLAPGTWQITGVFPQGSPQRCEREVIPGRMGHVRLDQEEGCVDFDRPGTEVDARNAASVGE